MPTAAIAGPAILAGGSILSSVISSKSAKKGRKAAERAADESRANAQPFTDVGKNILGDLYSQASRGLDVPLERAEGFNAIQNSAAAGRKLHSGGTLKGLTSFNNMLNARNNEQIFNQMFNVARMGANTAVGQGTNAINSANSIANSYQNQGAAQAAGVIGVTDALTEPSFLDYITNLNNTNISSGGYGPDYAQNSLAPGNTPFWDQSGSNDWWRG